MKNNRYVTRRGDTVDYIAWRFYGETLGGVIEQLLEANPGLSDHGPILPPGVTIELVPVAPRDMGWEGALWD